MLLSSLGLISCANSDVKVAGNIDYTRENAETLAHSLEVKYRQLLYSQPQKRYSIYLGGKIFIDYDIFNNETKINTLTSLGIDF